MSKNSLPHPEKSAHHPDNWNGNKNKNQYYPQVDNYNYKDDKKHKKDKKDKKNKKKKHKHNKWSFSSFSSYDGYNGRVGGYHGGGIPHGFNPNTGVWDHPPPNYNKDPAELGGIVDIERPERYSDPDVRPDEPYRPDNRYSDRENEPDAPWPEAPEEKYSQPDDQPDEPWEEAENGEEGQ